MNIAPGTQLNIAILGAGPAGVVVAQGLARLGYHVCVINRERKTAAIEGISERVFHALKHSGLNNALATVSEPVARSVCWNGTHSQANTERLLHRQKFNAALIKDLKNDSHLTPNTVPSPNNVIVRPTSQKPSIKYIDAKVLGFTHTLTKTPADSDARSNNWAIEIEKSGVKQAIYAHFIVDVRGRSATLASTSPVRPPTRGPETVAIAQLWGPIKNRTADQNSPLDTKTSKNAQQSTSQMRHAEHSAFTTTIATKRGWLWFSSSGNGQVLVQFCTRASSDTVPTKRALPAFLLTQVQSSPLAMRLLDGAHAITAPFARSSTCILASELCNTKTGIMRIGDAAMAVDPLSGNGIFQSLSSALVAPAVINTILQRPNDAALAADFYQQRVKQLFSRFCRIGRDFYRLEARYADEPFWQERSCWPDNEPAHETLDQIVGEAQRPVVNKNFIEEKTVVLTRNQPLGIWQVNDVEAYTLPREVLLKIIQNN